MERSGQTSDGAVVKRIVCLANSRKRGGRCVAGRELFKGKPDAWIRPVSDREYEELSEDERRYEDGSDVSVLDIIDVPLLRPKPKSHQPENWLLDTSRSWHRTGRFNSRSLRFLADRPGPLWINGHSTKHGLNDYVPVGEVTGADGSLKLIFVGDNLRLRVFNPGKAAGEMPKRRVQASFAFGGALYVLWVTDPLIESDYLARPDGFYTLGPSYLTISLGDVHEGRYYKLVAAIIGESR